MTPGINVYNQYMRHIPNEDNTLITIANSSSKGNAVKLDPLNLVFDIGLIYDRFPKDFFENVDYIFLTHEHEDHLNLASVRKVIQRYPKIKFIVPPAITTDKLPLSLQQANLNRFIHVPNQEPFYLKINQNLIKIQAIPTHHAKVHNTAYEINFNQYLILYATDLQSTQPLPDHAYDLLLLEANYDEELMPTETTHKGNYRHLSEQEALHYLSHHLKPHGLFIPLHASQEFGNYPQPSQMQINEKTT